MTMMNLLPNNIIMEVNEDIEPSFSTRITSLGMLMLTSFILLFTLLVMVDVIEGIDMIERILLCMY